MPEDGLGLGVQGDTGVPEDKVPITCIGVERPGGTPAGV